MSIKEFFSLLCASCIVILEIFGICFLLQLCSGRTPVEKKNRGPYAKVDSIATANDSIKVELHNLDSIKNAKVIEVNVLDNDSTIKLFYELVSK